MGLFSSRLFVNLFTQSFRIVIEWFFVLKRRGGRTFDKHGGVYVYFQ